jgi:hypothetical protein
MARGVTSFRVRSLRATVLVAVLAVVLSPIAFLLVSNGLEALFSERALQRAEADARSLAEALWTATGTGRLDAIREVSAHARQRVRLLDADGTVLADVDRLTAEQTLVPRLGDLFYGPNRRSVILELSSKLSPRERTDVRSAREQGESAGCKHSTSGNLDYCAAAVRLDGSGQVVLVEGISRRALQALYESRRQLFKLTLVVLGLGLVLWWWLTRHIVKPIESLRRELTVRAAAIPHPSELKPPISTQRLATVASGPCFAFGRAYA